MLLNLIVYVMTVSLLLGLAAWALERAVRVFAFPTRWIWAGAMAGSFGYMLAAIMRPVTSSQPFGTVIATPLDALLTPVVESITRLDASPSGTGLNTLLGVVWVVLTLAVVSVLVRAHLRLRSDRSTWTSSELDGWAVLVSEDLGPGVVGWIRSAIVMPRWAFRMSPQERELMVRHEAEHCRAGDTRVAGVTLLLLALLPWNLPLWWQVHRLRVAIEIDCDERVLRRLADVKRYARLLVEIGARGTASRLSALAFARPTPPIERRILAMTDTRNDPRYIRTAGLTVLAALLVVASCQVEQPATVVEPEQVTGDARLEAIDGTERVVVTPSDDVGVEEASPTTDTDPEAVQPDPEEVDEVQAAIEVLRAASRLEPLTPEIIRANPELQAAAEALRAAGQFEPPTPTEVRAGPVFTPMTVSPEILNRTEIQTALIREYPAALRDTGIGGQVVVWFFISEEGRVLDRRISESSGQAALDAAALNVADVFRFSPALNREQVVQVWIRLPITFQVQN